MSNKAQKVISVFSYKGGVGKSTISLSLAGAISASGSSVVVVDIDATAKTASDIAADGLLPFPVEFGSLSAQNENADFIIVDHPPHSEAQSGADLLVLPVVPARGAVKAMRETLEALGESVRVVVAINEITASNAEREAIAGMVEAMCAEAGIPSVRIRKRSAHEYAQNRGGTVYQKEATAGTARKGLKEAQGDIEALLDVVLSELAKGA